MITLTPLSPREVYKDQLKIKRESGQNSGDGSPKERVKRIVYSASHVTFQRKTEKEIPKPFHNDKAKIRGRILFKRKGMMRSEVLNNDRKHEESWENLGGTGSWRKIEEIAT